jgi:hypothetical protein
MYKDSDGFPKVGNELGLLGVRVGYDVTPDAHGVVDPQVRGGMSVTTDATKLPPFLRPPSLNGVFPGPIYRIQDNLLPATLEIKQQGKHLHHHAVVGCQAMPLDDFVAELVSTRRVWEIEHDN